MKLEDQVCNLDLAKRLKELGVQQRSLFYWQFWPERPDDVMVRYVKDMSSHREVQSVSAFTVAELGKMLPLIYVTWQDSVGVWLCKKISEGAGTQFSHEDTEVNARAKMRIYLLENKLIAI